MDEEKIVSIDELRKAFEEATHTDEPVAIETPSGAFVNGDSTKTGTNEPKDYSIEFYLPLVEGKAPSGADLVMGGTAYRQIVSAKQKFITARIARKVRSYASTVALAFTKFKDKGDSEIYSAEELMQFFEVFDDEVTEACENLIVTVLGVPKDMMEYITDTSLMENASKILKNNPGFFQEN